MSIEPVIKTLQSSDGTIIHAEFAGDLSKPCVVFVHGATMSSLVFDGVFRDPALLREVCMVRYDLRGHGRSGMPEDPQAYTSVLFAHDYATVVREFGIQKPFIAVWSYGGTIPCDIYTHLGPESLAGIIYIAALPYLTPPVFPESITALATSLLKIQADPADVGSYFKAKADLLDAFWKDPDNVDYRLRLTWLAPSCAQSPQVVRNILTRYQDPQRLFEALRGGLPVLFLHGDADRIVDGEQAVKLMEAYSPGADVYEIKGAGHAPFHENQDEFVQGVLQFVKRENTSTQWD